MFVDKISGSTKERPGLSQVLEFLRAGDTLVVWRLDRLARYLKDLLALVSQFKEAGIHLTSITENIDTSSLNGRLIFHIFAALAEFECDLIKERTKSGLTAARTRGRVGGRPRLVSQAQEDKLRLLVRDPKFSPVELQEMFKISKAIYRYAKLNKE